MWPQLKTQWVMPVGGVALIWVVLFELNAYWFERLSVTPYVGWLFLPAALRVVSVLLFQVRGVWGLFLGAMITNGSLLSHQPAQAFALSITSAIAPALALWLGIRWLKLTPALQGLNGWQLLGLAGLSAVSNSLLHTALFYMFNNNNTDWMQSLVPMTVGDFAGTLIVLYSAYFVMRWASPIR